MAGNSVSPRATRPSRSELAAAGIGTVVESYDWMIYAVLAPYFAEAVFPGSDPVTSLLGAYVVFAVGFVVRPLGAVIMGRIADRKGRKFGMVLSVILISVGSLMIAVTPTYGQAGLVAAVIVVAARLLQGLSVSGEQPAAFAYVVETSPPRRVYFRGAIVFAAQFVGQILAFITLAVLIATVGAGGLADGGWRIGFLVAAALGVVAMWIRSGVEESEVFTKQVAIGRPRQLPLLLRRKRQLLAVFLVTVGGTVGFYFATVYLPVFAANVGAVDKESAATQMQFVLVAVILLVIGCGALADRFGGLRVLRAGYVYLVIATVPLAAAMAAGVVPFLAGALLYGVGLSMVSGTLVAVMARQFPPAIRVLGMGVPMTLAISLFGGTIPMIGQAMTSAGKLSLLPWYIGATALLGLVGSLIIRGRDLDDSHAETAHASAEVETGTPSLATEI